MSFDPFGFGAQLNSLSQKLDVVLSRLNQLIKQERIAMSAMSDAVAKLQADVASENSVIDSAEALLVGLKKQLDDAIAANSGGDPKPLSDLSSSIGAKTAELAAAVTANTPPALLPAAPAAPANP